MANLQSVTGAVGDYDQSPLILHVIPTGTTDLHFLTVKGGQVADYWKPASLARVLPKGFVATAATVSHDPNDGLVQEIFFANADVAVRLCHNPFYPYMIDSWGVFNLTKHFGNQLNADEATAIGIEEESERMFVSRRRRAAAPDEAAEVIVLELDASCGMTSDNQV